MPSCVFKKCNNYTGTRAKTKKDVSFHLFPKDELLRQKWIRIARAQRREDDWMPTTFSTICSQHFMESDKYVTKKNSRKLIKTAIPVVEHKEIWQAVSDADDDSLKNVPISDLESVFDTPRKAYLKKEIAKISQAKKKLQMKNYNLAKQNKRLKQKCVDLNKILLKLKKDRHFTVDQ